MTKLRVYELARELNVETKVLLSKLKGAARNLSHQSTLTDQQVAELRGAFKVAAPTSAASSSDAGKPRVVIRRRVASAGSDTEGSGSTTGGSLDSSESDTTLPSSISESAYQEGPANAGSEPLGETESSVTIAQPMEPAAVEPERSSSEPLIEAAPASKEPVEPAAKGQTENVISELSNGTPKVASDVAVTQATVAPNAPSSIPPQRSSFASATIVRSAASTTTSSQRQVPPGFTGSAGGGYQGRPATGRPEASVTPRQESAPVIRDDRVKPRDQRELKDQKDTRESRENRETRDDRSLRENREESSRRADSSRGGQAAASRPQPVSSSPSGSSQPVQAGASAQQGAAAAARRRDVGGATIVRRATPEEVENLQNLAAKRQQAGRKEDHRGTRVTGIGLLQNRISADSATSTAPANVPPPMPPSEEDGWSQRRGTNVVKDKKTLDEEEQARKKAAKNRRSGTSVNMRALLEQIDEVAVVDEEALKDPAGRTVYTPSASRSKRDLKRRKDLKKTQITTPRAAYRIVEMGEAITVGELAKQLSVKAPELIKKLMVQGVMATINQTIDVDTATLLAGEFGFEVKSMVTTVDDILKVAPIVAADLEQRPPIVTVMGHVDHGKTSILDAIRSANVASGEAGGITQHIGAYSVERDGKRITFLDTPGHEAFSAMRARGAKVTDIVVLVVAADDGVMPQTKEAVSHAKAANVPLIVAINKIDKPNVNFDRVYTELTELGVQAEEWGGETQFIKCSALKRLGIDELLDAILLQSEVLDLKATHQGMAEGAVIEAHLDRGRGPVATIVVQRGTLKVGDYLVAGTEYGRIRAMHDYHGLDKTTAGPSDPVEVIGLSGVPMAGDKFNVVADEKTAREAAAWRLEQARRAASGKSSAATLEDLLARVKTEDVPEVPIIVKADTQGSLEAICDTILKLSTPKVRNRIIHSAVGGVTESDVTLAQASNSLVVGFNVRANRGLEELAERVGVPVKYFSIIYEIVDAVKAIMVGKLPPIVNEVVLGHAEVRKPISVPKIGTIAGSAVLDGKITRASQCRLIRDNVVIFTGKLGSLRRFKDDVKEVVQGYECGIGIDGYNDLREGDVIEAFVFEEQTATL
jgi:translation initiation factor IF-2